MAKCTRKLIDAEAAKEILRELVIKWRARAMTQRAFGIDDGETPHYECAMELTKALAALDALPDASEQAIHTERIPVPPHLAEAQRVVIRQAQQAGDGAEEK